MTSFLVLLLLLLLGFLSTTITTSVDAARQFTVGDHFGWREPDSNNTAFYTQWAERNRFQIGDSLVFEYVNDSVLTVEKMDYFSCETSSPITEFTNGKSTLDLDRSGAFYFISGTDDHCNHGQKLLVEVMAPHDPVPVPASDAPSSSTSLPPQQDFSPSLAPSPSYNSDTVEGASSSSIALTSTDMPQLVTFVVVMMMMMMMMMMLAL